MSRYLTLAIFVASLLVANLVNAADWPIFLGPNANGFSSEKLVNKDWTKIAPALLWKVDLSDNGYAGPSVVGDKVFIIDHHDSDDIVRALNVNTGAEVWHYTYADTNRANWGFARSTPVIDGENVYILSRLGIISCLNIKTGSLIWTRDLMAVFGGHRPGWDLSMSPFIDKEKLILTPGGAGAAVVALNKTTGATIWQGGGSDVPGYATPVLATINNKRQYLIFTVKQVMGVDTETGEKLWGYPWKTGADVNACAPIVIDNKVFISTGYGHGSALLDVSQTPPAVIWQSKSVQSRFSTPIYADGYLYTTNESNNLMCVNALTGEIKWKQPGFEWGGITAIDGMLIVGDGKTGEHVLCKMSPDAYQECGRFTPLGGQSWNSPVIANGKLYIRNLKALACFNLN